MKVRDPRKIMWWLLGICVAVSLIVLINRSVSGYDLEPIIKVSPQIAYPGDLILVEIIGNKSEDLNIRGDFGGKKLNFFHYESRIIALTAIDLNQKSGEAIVSVSIADGQYDFESVPIKIIDKQWPKRMVPEPEPLLGKKLERWQKEKILVKNAIAMSSRNPLWYESFYQPLSELTETSPFGEKRISPVKIRQHKGTDYKAALGTPVRAINSGRVVLTGNFLADGKIVIIDHGLGLHSIYLHLSQITVFENVKKGQVKRGQVIGRAGSTGFSSGPHLHLETRLNGEPFDSEQIFQILK